MRSRNEKIRIYIVLSQALGLLLTLLCSFLGGMYMFNGNLLIAAPVSVIFVVVLYYLVVFFCNEKENRKRSGYPPIFYYLFTLYAVISFVLSFFVLHFCNVEFFEKKEIQNQGLLKLEGLETIYKRYDASSKEFISNFNTELRTNLQTLANERSDLEAIQTLTKKPFNMEQDAIDRMVNNLNSEVGNESIKSFVEARKVNLEEKAIELMDGKEEFFVQMRNSIDFWDRMNIGSTMEDLNNRLASDYKELNDFLLKSTANRQNIPPLSKKYYKENLMDNPLDLAIKHLGIVSIGVLLIFQFIILLPYFLTKGRTWISSN